MPRWPASTRGDDCSSTRGGWNWYILWLAAIYKLKQKIKVYAAVVELVYTPVLGTGFRKRLGVRVSPAARKFLIWRDENWKGSGNESFPWWKY